MENTTSEPTEEVNGEKRMKITFLAADPDSGEVSSVERFYDPTAQSSLEGSASMNNILIGNNAILDVGRIEWQKPEYHSERYIYPIGYKAQRHYTSYVNPEARIVYTCEILEGEKVVALHMLLIIQGTSI
jgi:hypothetical protein